MKMSLLALGLGVMLLVGGVMSAQSQGPPLGVELLQTDVAPAEMGFVLEPVMEAEAVQIAGIDSAYVDEVTLVDDLEPEGGAVTIHFVDIA